MSAYLIIQATVHDWQKFAKYTEVVPPLVEKFGGQYIAMGPVSYTHLTLPTIYSV